MIISPQLIRLFSAVVPAGEELLPPVEVNLAAMPAGYYVEPAACTPSTLRFLENKAVNYNSTFYASRSDVTARSRVELLIDQLIHYASTYGTDFSAPAYTRNPEPALMAFMELKTLRAVSPREMDRMCMELLAGSAAIKSEYLPAVAGYVADFRGGKMSAEEIEAINNREARIILYSLTGTVPAGAQDIMRLMVYKATGTLMLIKSQRVLDSITVEDHDVHGLFLSLPKESVRELAAAYYRYEPYLLSFKQNWRRRENEIPECRRAAARVNYLRRLARKVWEPLQSGALDRVASPDVSAEALEKAAAREKNIFRLVRILGYIQMSLSTPDELSTNLYIIRDGRLWVEVRNTCDGINGPTQMRLLDAAVIIRREIVERLRRSGMEGKRIRFPRDLRLAAPTSQKNFVGSIPVWSSIELEENNFIGIYWRNEWGAHDFDLSVTTDAGERLGWNSNYYNPEQTIVYSGDMTDANPEAAEIIYCEKGCPEAVFYANRYNGAADSRFRLFYGVGKPENPVERQPDGEYIPGQNFCIHVLNVRVEAEVVSTQREQLVGYTRGKRFFFVSLGSGNSRVSSAVRASEFMDAIKHRSYSAIDLRALLLDAGAVEVGDSSEADIDLSAHNLNQATVLNLFQ